MLGRIADKLPIKWKDDGFVVGDQEFTGSDLGLAMVYPNPLNPKKYVVVYSGTHWGRGLPFNHKLDLLPDFIVFNSDLLGDLFSWPYAGKGPNQHLCAGFFDKHWQLSDKLTWGK